MSDGLAQLLGIVLKCVIRKKGRGGKPPDQSAKRKAQSVENDAQSAGNETSEAKASLSE